MPKSATAVVNSFADTFDFIFYCLILKTAQQQRLAALARL